MNSSLVSPAPASSSRIFFVYYSCLVHVYILILQLDVVAEWKLFWMYLDIKHIPDTYYKDDDEHIHILNSAGII